MILSAAGCPREHSAEEAERIQTALLVPRVGFDSAVLCRVSPSPQSPAFMVIEAGPLGNDENWVTF